MFVLNEWFGIWKLDLCASLLTSDCTTGTIYVLKAGPQFRQKVVI